MKHIDIIVILFVVSGLFADCGFDVTSQYSFWCAVGYSAAVILAELPKPRKNERK